MKVKLLILLSLFTAFSVGSKAQNLTFEQTVDYLKGFIKANNMRVHVGTKSIGECCSNCYPNYEISIEKSGRITFTDLSSRIAGSFNAFDVETGSWVENEVCCIQKGNGLQVVDKNKKLIADFCGIPLKAEADRFYRAILYLKTVCNKSADPFGN